MIIVNSINKTGFTPISNKTLRDDRISGTALGVLCYLLSHSEVFETSHELLQGRFRLSDKPLRNVLAELKEFGYLRITRAKDPATGRFEKWDWTVFGESQVARTGRIDRYGKERLARSGSDRTGRIDRYGQKLVNAGKQTTSEKSTEPVDSTGSLKKEQYKERTKERRGAERGQPRESDSNKGDLEAEALPDVFRLDESFEISEKDRVWAKEFAEDLDLRIITEKFKIYYSALPDSDSRSAQADWSPVWRNWILREVGFARRDEKQTKEDLKNGTNKKYNFYQSEGERKLAETKGYMQKQLDELAIIEQLIAERDGARESGKASF